MIKTGFIVPVYNHGATLELVVKNLLQYELPIIVVDDGNDEANRAFIKDVAEKYFYQITKRHPMIIPVIMAKKEE